MPDMLVKFTSGNKVFSSASGGVEDKHTVSRTTVEINSTSATHFYGSLVNVKQLNIKGDTTLYGALGVTDGVEIDSSKTLTLDNGTTSYNGVITGTGNLTKAGEGDVTFGGVIGTENEFFGTLSVGSGSVNLQNTSYLTAMNITGGSATVNNGTIKGLVLTGGSVNLTGNATIGQTGVNMTVGPNKNRTSGIYGYNGTITIGGGETSNTVTTTRVELGDINEANKGGILTVATNATLIITGNSGTASTTSGNYGAASFLMGEWGSNSTLNVSGLVLAQNAPLLNGDKQAIININNGGVLAVKGIGRNGGNGVNLTLSDGAKLILGSDGMQSTSTLISSLNAGTIGIYADTTISKNLTLGSNTTGTKFDTQLYEWSEGGASISQGENGGSLTISGVLSGEGKLVKAGAGTLTLSGANTYSGGTTIAAGTLSITDAQSLGTGGVTVEGSAELEYAGSTGSTVTALTLKDGAKVNTSSTGTLTATTAAAEGAFTKNGTGTLVLSTVSQLSGTVTVNAGILQIDRGDRKLNSAQVNGGTLRLTGTDTINWGNSVNIQVLGGTLDLDARQSVNSTTAITLNNGTIEGDGGPNRGYTVGLELYDTSTLTITSTGTSSITTNIGMRKESGNNGGTVKFDVTDGTLTVSGKIEKNKPTDATISGKVTKSGAGELILSGNNTYANGTTIEAGTVTTQHTNALGSGGVTMTGGELKVTDVADTDSDLSLKGMLEMNATASAKLATAGTTLNLGTTGSVKKTYADGSQYVTISSDGTNDASMTAKTQNAQLVQLAQDATFTIEDMTLTNTTVTAATVNTKVNLSNVSTTGVQLAKGKFHMQGQLPVALVNAGGSAVEFSSSALSGLTLNTADSSASLVVDLGDLSCLTPMGPGKYDLTITLSGFTMSEYSSGILFAGDSWLGELLTAQGATQYVASGDVAATANVGGGAGGSTVGVSFQSNGSVGTIITITGLNVPEPTTSTLSLLALAALAARRRRK